MVNALVGYNTWYYVGAEEFGAFHKVDAALIIRVFVIFFFFNLLLHLLILKYRPGLIPTWMVVTVLALYLINFISTIAIQIPIQNKLNEGFSKELIDELIKTDFIYRRTTITLIAIINSIMLFKVIKKVNNTNWRLLPYLFLRLK